MDIGGIYRWWWHKRRLTPKEIAKMKENMRKAPIIQKKSEIYHQKEQEAAEELLKKIDKEK